MPDVVKIEDRRTMDQGDDLGAGRDLGAVLKLCEDRRGRQIDLTYAGNRAMVMYHLPLNEVVLTSTTVWSVSRLRQLRLSSKTTRRATS